MTSITTRDSQVINRSDLTRLVHAFYADVRQDALLGPVFRPVIGDHWEHHLERMVDFWSTVMLGSRSFKGNVYGKHVALAESAHVTPDHFLRWITLWYKHTAGQFPVEIARELQQTAEGIGRNLFYGFFQQFAKFVIRDGIAIGYVPAS